MAKLELKKKELEPYLLTISSVNPATGQLNGGLLSESIKLGTKRKLQKIHKALLDLYKERGVEIEEVKKECGEDEEKLKNELNELFNEVISIEIDPFKISDIEGITSSANYDFDIIEKIGI